MGYLKPLTTGATALVFLAGTATSAGADDLLRTQPADVEDAEFAEGPVIAADTGDTGRSVGSGSTADPLIAVGARDGAGGRIVGGLDLESSHHGGPGDLRAGPWCNNQCITSGVAYQHGTGVRLVVGTSVSTDIYWYGWNVDSPADSLGEYWTAGATTHEWVIPDLEPGATYFVQVWASDEYGNSSSAWGSFTLPA